MLKKLYYYNCGRMNRTILIILFVASFTSCQKITKQQDEIHSDAVKFDSTEVINPSPKIFYDTLNEQEFLALFTCKELSIYDLQNNQELISNLDKALDFWTNKRILINDSLKRIGIRGFPLTLRTMAAGNMRLTTIGEGESQNVIRLFTLDKYYNVLGTEILSSYGGDEGIFEKRLGEFKNDSLYQLTTLTSGFDTDSIVTKWDECFVIGADGVIKKLESCR